MEAGMIHKRIIGICWLVIGALIVSVVLLNFASLKLHIFVAGLAISAVYFAAGVALTANVQRLSWLYLTCAVLSLFTFPIGTVVGAYYLWYYFAIERTP
jgi:hypothetical protein